MVPSPEGSERTLCRSIALRMNRGTPLPRMQTYRRTGATWFFRRGPPTSLKMMAKWSGCMGSNQTSNHKGHCAKVESFATTGSQGRFKLVADGSEVYTEGPEKGTRIFRGAQNPSVSADGRYVVFSTAQQLVPQDTNENVDVYVRDMEVPPTPDRKDSGAYTLVSAKSGGDEPATYGASSQSFPGDQPGSEVWPNTAISADGNYVVFRTGEVTSDLPDGGSVIAPEQLFVRSLSDRTTTLVSRETAGGAPAGGAVGPASISGDGTTVAWVGTNAPAQTTFLPGESLSVSQPYYLWQRWREDGRTRRITGLSDPEDPGCLEGEGVTQGPLSDWALLWAFERAGVKLGEYHKYGSEHEQRWLHRCVLGRGCAASEHHEVRWA